MKRSHAFLLTLVAIIFMQPLSLKSTTYYLKSTGSVTVLANWGINTDGSGTAPTSFSSSTTHTWNLYNQSSITLSSTWTVSSNARINVGDGINPVNLVLSTAQASINTSASTANQPTIIFQNASTLSINANIINRFDVGKTIFDTGSTVVYNSGSDNGIRNFAAHYHHLVINSDKSAASVNIYGDLTLNANLNVTSGYIAVVGNLVFNNTNLTFPSSVTFDLHGSISGIGNVSGSGGEINFYGSGNLGTLTLLSPYYLDYVGIYPSSHSTTLTLGSDLHIDLGIFTLNEGKVNLNGHTLLFEQYCYPDFSGSGTIIGTSASNIVFNTNAIDSLPMEPGHEILAGLTVNCPANSIFLQTPLSIVDQLTITDGTLVINSTLTLEADNARSARIAPIGTGGAISGNVTVEAFAPGGSTGWTLMGVNGVQGRTVGDWDTQIPMTCENCVNGVTAAGSYFESIQGWNEATGSFDTTINVNTSLSPGRGFWVYLGNGLSSSTDMTWSFSGPVQQGAIGVPVTSTGITPFSGYNLVANPYASPVDWESIYALGSNSSNLSGQIHVYNPDIPGFASYTQGGASVNGGTNIIAAGQAFYVLANSSTTLNFDESVKSTNNTSANPLLKQLGAQGTSKLNLLRLQLAGKYDKDETVLNIIPDATSTFDRRYDAFKIFSTPGYVGYPGPYTKYTSISTKDEQGTDYSINAFANSFTASVPLLVKVSTTGSYTITATEFKNFSGCAILHDLLTNTYHDITSGPYSFNVSDTTNAPRFEITCKLKAASQNAGAEQILIGKDQQGIYVRTNFEESTKTAISTYNAIGQRLIKDIVFEGTQETIYLDMNVSRQVVIVRVTTSSQNVTKKIAVD